MYYSLIAELLKMNSEESGILFDFFTSLIKDSQLTEEEAVNTIKVFNKK